MILAETKTAGRRLTTLAELITSTGADGIWQHTKFATAGVPPPLLTVKSVKAFVPSGALSDTLPRLVRHVEKSQKLSLLWAVKLKDNKILPFGLAVLAGKMITAKAEGTTV